MLVRVRMRVVMHIAASIRSRAIPTATVKGLRKSPYKCFRPSLSVQYLDSSKDAVHRE